MTDLETARELRAASTYEREHDEWLAVAFEIDTDDFVPTILPSEVSDVISTLERGEVPRSEPIVMRARLSTGVEGWVLEED